MAHAATASDNFQQTSLLTTTVPRTNTLMTLSVPAWAQKGQPGPFREVRSSENPEHD